MELIQSSAFIPYHAIWLNEWPLSLKNNNAITQLSLSVARIGRQYEDDDPTHDDGSNKFSGECTQTVAATDLAI